MSAIVSWPIHVSVQADMSLTEFETGRRNISMTISSRKNVPDIGVDIGSTWKK